MYLSYMFKLQSPLKHSPDAIHLLRLFPHCSKQFLNSLILIPFSAYALFCFTSSALAKCFLLRTFVHSYREISKKKCHLEWQQVNREGRARVLCSFWSKTAKHSAVWAGALINHPSWDGKTRRRSLQKNSLKLNGASHIQLIHWYRLGS